MSASKYKVGDIVILQNLKIRPECNDLETTVIGPNVLRQPLRGSEPLPVERLYKVDINLPGWEPGLLVAEHQMRHGKPSVELASWLVIQEATNWKPTHVTADVDPPGTPLPASDLSDMDRFHEMAASGELSELIYRLAGCNVLAFKRRAKRSEPE